MHKEPKFYLYHWAGVQNDGAKLENLIACHLLKSVEAWTDSAMGEFSLHYIRDKDKREVDFLITRDQKPWLLVEVKSGDIEPTPALRYYTQLLKPEFSIQVGVSKSHERVFPNEKTKIICMSAKTFLAPLN